MNEGHVPAIIRMQQAWANEPKPHALRPTWESSTREPVYGLLDMDTWPWWERILFRLSGGCPRWHPPFMA